MKSIDAVYVQVHLSESNIKNPAVLAVSSLAFHLQKSHCKVSLNAFIEFCSVIVENWTYPIMYGRYLNACYSGVNRL